jgi:cobalt-zinc-cadmium efflux system outer membrane protein
MSVSRFLTLRVVAAALCCGWANASEPWPEPRSIARDTPAFRAPEEPPEAAVEEAAAPAEPAAPLTLQDALGLALMNSPELADFSWEARAGEARVLQAKKFQNPELDLRFYRLGTRDGEENVARRRVILSQVFELGGKRRRRVDVAQLEQDMAGWDYEAKRIEVATAVAGRFVEVLGAQRRVESLTRFVEFFEQARDKVERLSKSGMTGSVEIHQITRRVGLARIELRSAESELSSARFSLAASWDNPSPRFTEAVGDLEQLEPVPDIETVIELAQQTPTVTRFEAEVARSQAALALAKANRVPDLRVGVGHRWQEHRDDDYLVDVEIDLPIFDRKQGDVREARYNMARAQAGRKAALAISADRIAEAYYALEESDLRRQTLRDEVIPAARAIVEAFETAFESESRYLDVLLDARRDVARAEVDYTDALVSYHLALTTLESVVGQSLTDTE